MAAFLATGLLVSAACAAAAQPRKTMKAFSSEREFSALLARWKAKAEHEQRRRAKQAAFAPPAPAAAASLDSTAATPLFAPGTIASDDITNVQTIGIDEGDIVKKRGDFLVVLRRGRLFTLRIGGEALQAVSTLDAHAPDADPAGTWYDEMLVSDRTVVVIGYSYARGGTEIGLFDLDARGGLRYRDTYQLRSNDYYSARNYASRLIGDRLVFYTPLELHSYRLASAGGPAAFMPALRHWRRDATPQDFKRILPATRIYRTDADLDPDDGVALHTVTTCDLVATPMRCESTAVLGPGGHVFYVSEDAVYVWTTHWGHASDRAKAPSVFRMPLDGAAPSALKASGSPIDQMSFLQRDGWLNVLVGSDGNGEGMWASDGRAGDLALLRVRIDGFGDGSTAARADDYQRLPRVDREHHDMQNRFVGDWLLYGTGAAWRSEGGRPTTAYAVRFATRDTPRALALGHAVERIDALGRDAVLVGSRGPDLHFTSVRLGQQPRPAAVHVERDAAQGDARTHGFFYKPETDDTGIVGLPVVGSARDTGSVLYLRNHALRLARLGTLDGHRGTRVDDGCEASCVDWYGNARPIFVGTRVFALLGYELVEGRIEGTRGIRETRRIDFTPAAPVSR